MKFREPHYEIKAYLKKPLKTIKLKTLWRCKIMQAAFQISPLIIVINANSSIITSPVSKVGAKIKG